MEPRDVKTMEELFEYNMRCATYAKDAAEKILGIPKEQTEKGDFAKFVTAFFEHMSLPAYTVMITLKPSARGASKLPKKLKEQNVELKKKIFQGKDFH